MGRLVALPNAHEHDFITIDYARLKVNPILLILRYDMGYTRWFMVLWFEKYR